MLEPWIIEEILRREERRRREEEGIQPTVPADDPREDPGTEGPEEAPPKPGYEMPNRDGGHRPDTGDRGVIDIPLGDMDIPKGGS